MADSPPGSITTHVLDIALGRPAAGIAIELRRVGQDPVLARAMTNADGRTDTVGEHLVAEHGPGPSPPFLATIPIRFGIADADGHHHVALLPAPHGYSTHRGS